MKISCTLNNIGNRKKIYLCIHLFIYLSVDGSKQDSGETRKEEEILWFCSSVEIKQIIILLLNSFTG